MAHKLGVSGSTIYSNPELYSELFWEGVQHIEIGEFPDENALDKFISLYIKIKAALKCSPIGMGE